MVVLLVEVGSKDRVIYAQSCILLEPNLGGDWLLSVW